MPFSAICQKIDAIFAFLVYCLSNYAIVSSVLRNKSVINNKKIEVMLCLLFCGGRSVRRGKGCRGIVKWFDPVKGYGFLVPISGGVDVLVHHSILRAAVMILFTPAHG